MDNTIHEYREKLVDKIKCYMSSCPVTDETAHGIGEMLECLEYVDKTIASMHEEHHGETMTPEDAKAWLDGMKNVDGSMGAHWTEAQTSSFVPDDVTVPPWAWNVTMNMEWSDKYEIARKYGVDRPEFYADLARAFLLDPDGGGPEKKLTAYYYDIVKKA